MATFTKRGKGQWQVKIRRKGCPLQTKTFETKGDAEAWAREIESEMDRICNENEYNFHQKHYIMHERAYSSAFFECGRICE
ncbi:DUF2188 domain-containing protein [Desulfoplanes formicivorans]|uniref:Integrase n=1 Tax=Desulfoplanes formicivorans TaxID=1592317 RepID=A0A194AI26_9BACT|nr:DUF2188 domain-containing protein [Desulfoplanes formicivorans]GAU08880.1 integrase [Desulfoplanes formicivorans]